MTQTATAPRPCDLIVPAAQRILALLPADLNTATMAELLEARDLAWAAAEIQCKAAKATRQANTFTHKGVVWLMLVRSAITDAIGDTDQWH